MAYYPESARQAHEQGTVKLEFTITQDGAVANATVLKSSGFPDLDDAALEAVQTWRYKPAQQDGKPIAVVSAANIKFQLTDDTGDN